MAVVMMDEDDKKPIFHDFLGMSCGDPPAPAMAETKTTATMESEATASVSASVGVSADKQGLVSRSSDPVSERQLSNYSDVLHNYGKKVATFGPEASNSFSGRKRSNSDSAYIGIIKDKIHSTSSDFLENSRSMKMLGKAVACDQSRKYLDDEVQLPMQPPLKPASSLIIPSLSSRPDFLASKCDRFMQMNPGSVLHYPPRIIQTGAFRDKFTSSYASKDTNISSILMSQPAADEGSRTGIKGSGVMNVVNTSSGAGERSMAGVLPCISTPKDSHTIEPDSSNGPRYHGIQTVSRQMTIFYAGQAHVFDDVHPNKADVIMALAGSNGGSWSTAYFDKPSFYPSTSEVKVPSCKNEIQTSSLPSPIRVNTEQVVRIVGSGDSESLASGFESGRVVRHGRLGTQAPLSSVEGKRDAC
ncbi:Protein TIFY 8 [Apostasia shenzhenica]|uniref:Protein TIFY n=1 Tax=Apostasia shenzhenica TaxID=1088818 RepID=A0A2I0ANS1_9ASPA|nr:Protein TIFY 8 [Apostasia shenzhenica]